MQPAAVPTKLPYWCSMLCTVLLRCSERDREREREREREMQIALRYATGPSTLLCTCTMDGSCQVQDLVRVGVTDACEARG
jgi:hypothetical protein